MKVKGVKKVASELNYVRSLGRYSGYHCEIWLDVKTGKMWANAMEQNWETVYHNHDIINMYWYMECYDRKHNIDSDTVKINMHTLKFYGEKAVEEYSKK